MRNRKLYNNSRKFLQSFTIQKFDITGVEKIAYFRTLTHTHTVKKHYLVAMESEGKKH